jgi:hypothetical protein
MSRATERTDVTRAGLLVRYPLTSFFVMAFTFSWIAGVRGSSPKTALASCRIEVP